MTVHTEHGALVLRNGRVATKLDKVADHLVR